MAPHPYELSESDRPDAGLIVLQTDERIEDDFRRLLPGDAARLFVTRVPSGADVTAGTLGAMSAELTAAARLLPPSLQYRVVGYGCTSGSSVIGPDTVADRIRDGCRAEAVTEPLSALVRACRRRGVNRLALLSPYVEEVSRTLREALAARGIDRARPVPRAGCG